jgi:homoserine dehydrogenase
MLTSEGGLDLTNWRQQYEEQRQPADLAVSVGECCVSSVLCTAVSTLLVSSFVPLNTHTHTTVQHTHTHTHTLSLSLCPSPPPSVQAFGAALSSSYIPNLAIVDCTASDVPPTHYLDWMRAGINIITPNKKLGSGPLERCVWPVCLPV